MLNPMSVLTRDKEIVFPPLSVETRAQALRQQRQDLPRDKQQKRKIVYF